MESYSEHTQTRTFENHANVHSLTWQTDYCSPWRMAFNAQLNAKAALFLGFGQVLFVLVVRKNCQSGLLLKHSYMYCRLLINYLSGHIDDLPTLS